MMLLMVLLVQIYWFSSNCYRIVIDRVQQTGFSDNESNIRFVKLVHIASSNQIVIKYVYDTSKLKLQCLKYNSNTKMFNRQYQNFINENSVYQFDHESAFKMVNAQTMVLTQKLANQNYLEYVFQVDSNNNLKNLTKMPNTIQQSLTSVDTQTLASNYFNFYNRNPTPTIMQYNSQGKYMQTGTFRAVNNNVSPQILSIGNKKYVLYFYSQNSQNQFVIQEFGGDISSLNSQQTVIKTFSQQHQMIKIKAKQINDQYLVVAWLEKVGSQYKIDLHLFSVQSNNVIQPQRIINIMKQQSNQPNLLEIETYQTGDKNFMILNYGNDTVYSYCADISTFQNSTIDSETKKIVKLSCNPNYQDEIGQLVTKKQKGLLEFMFYCQHQQQGLVDLVKTSYTDQKVDNSTEEKQYTKYIVFIVLGVLFVLAIVIVMFYLKKKIKEKRMTDMIRERRKTKLQNQKPDVTKIRISNTKKKSAAKPSQIHNKNELVSLNDDKKGLIRDTDR